MEYSLLMTYILKQRLTWCGSSNREKNKNAPIRLIPLWSAQITFLLIFYFQNIRIIWK